MNPVDRSERIRALFDEVVGLEPEVRAVRLSEACGDDKELRREVESLLEAADASTGGAKQALEGLRPEREEARPQPDAPVTIPANLQAALADRYSIEREIGRGGMATVYLADDLRHERRVAIKVLNRDLSQVLGADRFLREIKTAASLTHPHILPLHDSGEAEGLLYYVMPYVEGESLRDRLRREEQLPVEDAVRIAREVADALAYAHDRGVIHRDVKPANILLEADHAVLADFGIAKAVEGVDRTHVTQTGTSLGTPTYMSPEQMSGDQRLDGRADQYALGCVLYEMLAGQPPHRAPNLAAIVAKMMEGPAPSVRTLRSEVPEAVEKALAVALEREPQDRHATVADFAAALTAGAPPTAKPRWLRWVGTAAMAVMIVLAWYVGASRSGDPAIDSGEGLSANRIVVLPFNVRGSEDLAEWQEWLAILLAYALDGAGELSTVDSRAVLGFVEREPPPAPLDPEIGREIAARLGADSFILGDLIAGGGGIRAIASLYGVSGEPESTAEAMVAEENQILSDLVDEVARQLVVRRADVSGDPFTRVGAVTTRSLPALKAYLRGEALVSSAFMNPAVARSAVAEYRQAVDADSTFALAYFRMGLLQGYTTVSLDIGDARERARRFSDRLPPQERRLLECYLATAERRDERDAERLCSEVRARDPNNADASFFLGDALHHYGLRRGRTIAEVREVYDRALELEPSHLYPMLLNHRGWIARFEEDFDTWAEYTELSAQVDRQSPSSRLYQLAVDAWHGDESALDQLITAVVNEPVPDLWLYLLAMETWPLENRSATIQVLRRLTALDRSRAQRATGHVMIAQEELAAGRLSAARAELSEAQSLNRPRVVSRVYLLLSPYLAFSADEFRALRDEVAGWNPDGRSNRVWRMYLLGLLDERLGDPTGAERYASALQAYSTELNSEDVAGAAALAEDLALYLRARLAFREERYEEAWELLQQTAPERWWANVVNSVARLNQLYERWLAAEVLVALGRPAEALNWLAGFGMVNGERSYMGIRHFRMAEIYEELDDPENARHHYGRFVTYWKDADPELQPRVEQAQRRIEALSAEG